MQETVRKREEQPAGPGGASTRTAVWAGAGVVAILGVALLIAAFAAQIVQTRVVVRNIASGLKDGFTKEGFEESLERLGDPGQATRRLSLYLRLPGWAAPDKTTALYLLGYCSEEAVPVLVAAMDDEDSAVRYAAVQGLAELGPKAEEALPALIRALQDEDLAVRYGATWAVRAIGPPAKDAVPSLVKLLKDKDVGLRRTVAEALGAIGPGAQDAVPALREVVTRDQYARKEARKALRKIRGAEQEDD